MSNQNSINGYHELKQHFGGLRLQVFNFIKSNPSLTRKEIIKKMGITSENGGRITELSQAGYLNAVKDYSLNADRLTVKLGVEYNDNDFTSEKMEERRLLRSSTTKGKEVDYQIGKIVLAMCSNPEFGVEEKTRFLGALQKAIDTFHKDKNMNNFKESLFMLEKLFGRNNE